MAVRTCNRNFASAKVTAHDGICIELRDGEGRMAREDAAFAPEVVLDFWFPSDGHEATPERHRAFWTHRMRGGVDAQSAPVSPP